jgi:DNA-binding NarL/FixJ family response regulator
MNLQTKILVIEDDPLFLKTIRNVLVQNGYDVCIAGNGAIGIQKAFEYNPDLILCDIQMNPVDGYQVYNVLKESTLIDRIPFIFLTGHSELEEIRTGLDLGVDDYFVKPFSNKNLLNSIENRLKKFKKLTDIGRREFNALFHLTSNGIFLFNGNTLFNANPSLLKMLDLKEDAITSLIISDILDEFSFHKISEGIAKCSRGMLDSFSEEISLISKNGRKFEATISISVYEKYSGYSLMIAIITPIVKQNSESDFFISDVLNLLKKEKIVISESLGDKIAEVFKQHTLNMKSQKNEFFSSRENEILCLSMEGLPIKIIADKLKISDRTVEKHRSKLMEKTNSNNMIEVIIYALKHNLVEI